MQSGTSTRPLLFRLSLLLLLTLPDCHGVQPQNADPRFHGHQKTREERWHQSFGTDATVAPSARAQNLVRLLQRIVNRYMGACVTVVAYDEHVERNVDDGHVLRTFLSEFQRPYMHGRITANYTLANRQLLQQQTKTVRNNYIMLDGLWLLSDTRQLSMRETRTFGRSFGNNEMEWGYYCTFSW